MYITEVNTFHLAEPDAYNDTLRHRNITFPTADSSREVNLTCPIRPGALSERYRVQWELRFSALGLTFIKDIGNYDITEDIYPTSRIQYQCKVTILHRDLDEDVDVYSGPMIVLNKIGKLVHM